MQEHMSNRLYNDTIQLQTVTETHTQQEFRDFLQVHKWNIDAIILTLIAAAEKIVSVELKAKKSFMKEEEKKSDHHSIRSSSLS